MKKFILLIVVFFAFSTMFSQGIIFGVKAGVNLANLNSSVSEFNDEFEMRTAFHVGGVADVSISEQFSLQPELIYSSVGTKFEESEGGVTAKFQSIINYLSIPFMAKYYVAEGFSLQAGPQVGFVLSATDKLEISGAGEFDGTEEDDIKEDLESIDFGLGFGAAYKMQNGLFFDARYGLGLSNIAKEIDNDEWVKNNVIQVSVGYMFQ